MKFGDKYELLESLTTGVIETFVANDKVRGEQVLVHILDYAPQKPGQSTSEWVLESFRRVAPEPCGPVLETGKYSGTQYAYLVTKPADEAAQKGWVRRYEIQSQDTQETRTLEKAPEVSMPPATPLPSLPTKEPSQAPVSVTQLLRDFDSQIKPPVKPAAPAPPLPNLNLGLENSGLHSAPPWEPVHSPVLKGPEEESRIKPAPADAFGSDYKDKGFPSSTFPPVTKPPQDKAKLGEFTSFFQGPFRGDGPSNLPSLSSQPIEAPQKKVGEFTAVFGSIGSKPEQDPPALEESGNIPAPPVSFTGMFKDMERPPRTFNTSTPLPPPPSVLVPPPLEPMPEPAKPKDSFPSPTSLAPPPPVSPPSPAVLPAPSIPNVASPKPPLPKPSALPGDGATGAFLQPSANAPTPIVPEAPTGPSPYTQIISREKLRGASAEPGEELAGPPAGGKLAAPAVPKIPGLPPPKVPALKAPPPPPMPKIAAPKAPKLPKVDAPAPPPVSMMPLVLTLAVLFLLAVALVLYFVLKH